MQRYAIEATGGRMVLYRVCIGVSAEGTGGTGYRWSIFYNLITATRQQVQFFHSFMFFSSISESKT